MTAVPTKDAQTVARPHTTVGPVAEALPDRQRLAVAIDRLRGSPPRIHALVAPVAQPFVANILSALAVDISMTVEAAEMAVMARSSGAVLINLGMLDTPRREAARAAVTVGTPFVLDPVKVDRVPDRLRFAREVTAAGPLIVKGNGAEMAALGPLDGRCVAITTGARDELVHGARRIKLCNGTPLLTKVIATGCATGALVAALSAVEPDPLIAGAAAVALMGVAGEIASTTASGPGSFAVQLIDAVGGLTGADVAERVHLDH
ncbi:MAG: hydroxyethylthiazole kinase [Pseudomonadota bacterium]